MTGLVSLWRCSVVAAALWAGAAAQAAAPAWPSQPIRLVVPFSPGGSTDAVARLLAPPLSAALGRQVLVENRPGADGAIAGDAVTRAEPDGHTFLLATNTAMMQVPLLKKRPPYDPVKGFTPVSLIGRFVYVLVAAPSVPANDVGALLAHLRAHPGQLGYASYSSVTQLMHASLRAAQADTTLVPYKGESPAINALLGNHVQLTFATPATTMQHVREGRLRALAVMLPARSPLMPDVPTGAEAGLPPFTAGTWAALFAPPGLAPEIVQRMNRELQAAMQLPEVRQRVTALGFDLGGSSADELAVFVKDQLQAWSRAFREAGMTPE